ncbi:DUF397 domain-containing protein [Amycolatopsis cihanbeyliensis]|uniref:Uncharacterized protein DUF397 n=1 Tax=Amycolatopsis cihanbeyliensis TaxID=1128664 RepID=A0A542DLP1_AMYCI|nr:DUF397 domain-containing protein [Amycolatopsis cihanbeyliensis]TQJ04013.1 uncharacterized protein DUF397 [Amycolatopsis cihanbeyliensis]
MEWRTSSYSDGDHNSACVEVAFHGYGVAVRDSKSPETGTLRFPAAAWRAFLAAGQRGSR